MATSHISDSLKETVLVILTGATVLFSPLSAFAQSPNDEALASYQEQITQFQQQIDDLKSKRSDYIDAGKRDYQAMLNANGAAVAEYQKRGDADLDKANDIDDEIRKLDEKISERKSWIANHEENK